MRHIKIAGAMLAVGMLAACGEPPTGTMNPPVGGPRYAIGTCSPAQNIHLNQVWAGSALTEATNLWAAVTAACSSGVTGDLETALLTYLLWTLEKYEAGNPADFNNPSGNAEPLYNQMSRHWRQVLVHAGYDGFEGLEGAFELNGGVIQFVNNPSGPVDITIPGEAGLQLPVQGPDGAHGPMIFLLRPVSGECEGDNVILDEDSDTCFEFSVFPSKTFSPKLKVGVCYAYDDGFARPALAHIHEGVTTVLTPLPFPGPDVCSHQHAAATGIFGKATLLASQLFGVRSAYATHGGLGGLTHRLSFFQPVDLRLFTADFENSSVGSNVTEGELDSPEKGFWIKASASAPGSIKVGAPMADTLPSKHAVLNQGGGNCANCGGLDLWGRLKTANGANQVDQAKRYLVRWTSMQRQPTPKYAPIVITSDAGMEIARVSYSREGSANRLRYNGDVISLPWVRNRPQTFELLVDMRDPDNLRTTLLVINDPYGARSESLHGTKPFVQPAGNLATVRAQFSGQDSGIMAWDDITITQLPDDAP